MNKIFMVLTALLLTASAFAADKGEAYLSPTIGYHFFDNDHGLDDKVEGGLRLGYFFMDDHSLEIEGDYTKTDYDKGGDKSATSLSLSVLKYWDYNYYYKPFIFAGVGGLFHENDMGSLVLGIGARFIVNETVSFDARVKDMIHSIGARNDIIPSISLNIHFCGSYDKPVSYDKPAEEAKPAAEEEEKMAGESRSAKKESAAVVAQPEPKKDTDGDGVYDDVDQCPATPAGYPVASNGCTPDTDGDGVYDFEDKCPNTMKDVKVNSAGCFVSKTLQINFKTNSLIIDERFADDIREFAAFMKDNKHLNVEVQGHADSRGTDEYNMTLSQQRAEAVVKALTEKYGVSKDRLTAKGYGENKPVVPNDSPENMRKNRRIDTVVK